MKKKRKNTKLRIVLMFILIALIGFAVGLIIGKDIGEQTILLKLSTVFAGSNFEMNIDINETSLVQEVNKTLYPTIKERLRCCEEK